MPLLKRIANSTHKYTTLPARVDFNRVNGCRYHPKTPAVIKARVSATSKTPAFKSKAINKTPIKEETQEVDFPLAKDVPVMVAKPLLLVQYLEAGVPFITIKPIPAAKKSFKDKTCILLSKAFSSKERPPRIPNSEFPRNVSRIPIPIEKTKTPRPSNMPPNVAKTEMTAGVRRLRAAQLWAAAPKPPQNTGTADIVKFTTTGRPSPSASRSSIAMSFSTSSTRFFAPSATSPSVKPIPLVSPTVASVPAIAPEVPSGLLKSNIPFSVMLTSYLGSESKPLSVSGEDEKILIEAPLTTYETRGVGNSTSVTVIEIEEKTNEAQQSQKDLALELAEMKAENVTLRMRLQEFENNTRMLVHAPASKAVLVYDTKAIVKMIIEDIVAATPQPPSVHPYGLPPPLAPPPGMKSIIASTFGVVVQEVKQISPTRLGVTVNQEELQNSLQGLKKVSINRDKENTSLPPAGRFPTLRDCLRSTKGDEDDNKFEPFAFAGFRAALKPVSVRSLKSQAPVLAQSSIKIMAFKTSTSHLPKVPSTPTPTTDNGSSSQANVPALLLIKVSPRNELVAPLITAKPTSRVMQLRTQMSRVNGVTPAYQSTARNSKVDSELALLRKIKPVAKGLDNLVPVTE